MTSFPGKFIQTGQLEAIFWGGTEKKHRETSELVFNLTSSPLFGNRKEIDGIVHEETAGLLSASKIGRIGGWMEEKL